MSEFEKVNQEEIQYLESALDFIKRELSKEELLLDTNRKNLIDSRKEMWQESVHFSNDVDRIPEMNAYLSEVTNKTSSYENTLKYIEKCKRLLKSPYFGRFDFKEHGELNPEKIYIGMYNLIDNDTDTILVYDWRCPIASIFYQYEIGIGSYVSPIGVISGDVLMKRQYKIEDSKLKYFFDSSIKINDEILQQVLSKNSSSKMKNIVETIQREQDIIIRDTENELLIVQGVAGSGKTSIALHRIAFLLYTGMGSKINSKNIIIISPNSYFSTYISEVLPELGEENVDEITFDDIIYKFLGSRFVLEDKKHQLESLVTLQGTKKSDENMEAIEFKGSSSFVNILDNLLTYYEHSVIDFQDIYFDGKIIGTKEELKNLFLNNKINMPAAKRLKRIEDMILKKIHLLKKARLDKIEKIIQNSGNHELEIKSFSRLLSIKESKKFMNFIHKFTEVNYMDVYKTLFSNKLLFLKLSKGIKLPKNIEDLIMKTKLNLDKGYISQEDCGPLLYIKLKLEGSKDFSEIKQIVIDEAQDYYPIHYEIFKLLFDNPRYTILGDFNQTLEKPGDKFLYDEIEKILHHNKSTKIFLNKSYRSSIEINSFTQRILNKNKDFVSFNRHEDKPRLVLKPDIESLNMSILHDIDLYRNKGYESIAIICKTNEETKKVICSLSKLTDIPLSEINSVSKKSVIVLPSYLAKGLEFDVVLVYNVSKDNYSTEFDKRLLYVSCTRALHQLVIYCAKEKSKLIPAIM